MGANRIFQVCVIILFAGRILMFQQSDYIVTTERALISSCNTDLEVQVKFFKFNRTYTALNFSLNVKRDFGDDLEVKIQANKFLSNEYRDFPLTFQRNLCGVLKQNEFGLQNMWSCGNFKSCPINIREYHICNWGPDFSKFPPYIPVGQYRLDVVCIYRSQELCTFEWYVKVVSTKLI